MGTDQERAVTRTYLNCTWAERQMIPRIPLWLDGARWCCLALSEEAQKRVTVQPDRCASCSYWQPRAELMTFPR